MIAREVIRLVRPRSGPQGAWQKPKKLYKGGWNEEALLYIRFSKKSKRLTPKDAAGTLGSYGWHF